MGVFSENDTLTTATRMDVNASPPAMKEEEEGELTGFMKVATLPVYREYRRYLPAMHFYKDLVRVNTLINKICKMESDNFGAYYVKTSNGRHFNTCSWAQCRSDEMYDVVDTCTCMRIYYTTKECIELLHSMGLANLTCDDIIKN